MGSFTRLLERILSHDCSPAPGFLRKIDSRAKIIGLVCVLIAISFAHSPFLLAVCLVSFFACAVASRVPAWRFLEWLPAPVLFTLVIAAPAALNVVTEGRVLLNLPWGLAITGAGLLTAGRLILRVTASVSAVAVLALTTQRHHVLQGLRGLGVPRVVVVVLTMMERYLAILVRAAEQVHMAKLSRTIRSGGLREEHAWVAAGMGSLFRRSRSLAESVHLAMISRGFTGDHHTFETASFGRLEVIFLIVVAVFSAGVVAVGRLT
jgi:cobalt/nickel transport system permease protein